MEDEDFAPTDEGDPGIFARGMAAAEAAFEAGIDDLSDAGGAMGALTALSSMGLWPRPLLPLPVCSILGSGLKASEQSKQLEGEPGGDKDNKGDAENNKSNNNKKNNNNKLEGSK